MFRRKKFSGRGPLGQSPRIRVNLNTKPRKKRRDKSLFHLLFPTRLFQQFTLVELMIVVAIIGIIAAVAAAFLEADSDAPHAQHATTTDMQQAHTNEYQTTSLLCDAEVRGNKADFFYDNIVHITALSSEYEQGRYASFGLFVETRAGVAELVIVSAHALRVETTASRSDPISASGEDGLVTREQHSGEITCTRRFKELTFHLHDFSELP